MFHLFWEHAHITSLLNTINLRHSEYIILPSTPETTTHKTTRSHFPTQNLFTGKVPEIRLMWSKHNDAFISALFSVLVSKDGEREGIVRHMFICFYSVSVQYFSKRDRFVPFNVLCECVQYGFFSDSVVWSQNDDGGIVLCEWLCLWVSLKGLKGRCWSCLL